MKKRKAFAPLRPNVQSEGTSGAPSKRPTFRPPAGASAATCDNGSSSVASDGGSTTAVHGAGETTSTAWSVLYCKQGPKKRKTYMDGVLVVGATCRARLFDMEGTQVAQGPPGQKQAPSSGESLALSAFQVRFLSLLPTAARLSFPLPFIR